MFFSLNWWMVFIWAFWGLLMSLFWYWDRRDLLNEIKMLKLEYEHTKFSSDYSSKHLRICRKNLSEAMKWLRHFRELAYDHWRAITYARGESEFADMYSEFQIEKNMQDNMECNRCDLDEPIFRWRDNPKGLFLDRFEKHKGADSE